MLSAAESLASAGAIFISTDSKIVMICNDPASAQRGCAAALGLDYTDNGAQSAAQQRGVTFPDALKSQARQPFDAIRPKK